MLSLMYGDGVFGAWCGRNGFLYELDAHLDRLYRSVHALKPVSGAALPPSMSCRAAHQRMWSRRCTATSATWDLAVGSSWRRCTTLSPTYLTAANIVAMAKATRKRGKFPLQG